MTHLRWHRRPPTDQPVMIVAFAGWNDAGDAATTALAHLRSGLNARPFADIDAEEYYDFTVVRPTVRITDGDLRSVQWPENRFSHASSGAAPVGSRHLTDVVLLAGVEPQLRWRTFCSEIIDVAQELRCPLVLTLGALLADVPHTRPTPVYATASDPAVISALGLEPSRYEGPTGIVGVLHHECQQRDVRSASLWAAVPAYVSSVPSPVAAAALVERVAGMLDLTVDAGELADAAGRYRDEISALVAEDLDTIEYVRHLEERYDEDELADRSAETLLDEVERFLRDH